MESRNILLAAIGLALAAIIVYQQHNLNKLHEDRIFHSALSTYYTLDGVISGLQAFQKDHGSYPEQAKATLFPKSDRQGGLAGLSSYINPISGLIQSWTYQCTTTEDGHSTMTIFIADAGRYEEANILKQMITQSFAVRNQLVSAKERGDQDIPAIITKYPDRPNDKNPFTTITVSFPNAICVRNDK
jgi:hypothetical protein